MTPKQTLSILKNSKPGTYLTCRMSMAYSRERNHMKDLLILKVVKANKNGILTVGYVNRFADSTGVKETFVFDTQRSISKPNGQPYDQITVLDLQKKILEVRANVEEDAEAYDRLSEEYLNSKIDQARSQLSFYRKALGKSKKQA